MENKICVDTDVIVDHLRGKGPGVEIFEKIIKNATPFTTYINKFELLCGARQGYEIDIINETLSGFVVLPFEASGSYEAAKIYRELKIQGRLIGIRDIMIAGIVIANNVTFATKNVEEFKRIKGLKLIEVT